MTQEILIGKITCAHGIRGQVKIMSYAQNKVDIADYENIFTKQKKIIKINKIGKSQGKNQDIFICDIAGVSDRDAAERLANQDIFITKDQLKEIDNETEFYYADLVGLKVIDDSGDNIGIVEDVVNYGAGDIVEIRFYQNKQQTERLEMFSFCDETFPKIDIDQGFIKIVFPDILNQ